MADENILTMFTLDYLARALGAWFVGFFPLAEIYVAIPAAIAAGLDSASVVFWSVFGNYTPVLLIHYGYEQLTRWQRVRRWLDRLYSEKLKTRIERYEIGFVLLMTPWTGVWVMAVTAKILRVRVPHFFAASFVSILVYAIVLVILINAGIDLFD